MLTAMQEENTMDLQKDERPLSPVLNNSSLYRKRMFERKRSSKTRVQLSKRFCEDKTNSSESNTEFEFKKPLSVPTEKFKLNSAGFCTGSGKKIVIRPEVLKERNKVFKHILQSNLNENNPTVYKKDFSGHQPVCSTVFKLTKTDCIQTGSSNTQMFLDAEAAVCALNMSKQQKVEDKVDSKDKNNFFGFRIEDYQFSDILLERFKKCLIKYCEIDECIDFSSKTNDVQHNNTIDEFPMLDNTLFKVFASEELSLIESVSNQNDQEPLVELPVQSRVQFSVSADKKLSENEDKSKESNNVTKSESTLPVCRIGNKVSTSCDQNIKISDGAWNKTKHLFDDKFNSILPNFQKNTENANNILDELILPKINVNLPRVNECISSTGFSTAGGKHIKISDTAWIKTKHLFDDEAFIITTNEVLEVPEKKIVESNSNSHLICVKPLENIEKNVNIAENLSDGNSGQPGPKINPDLSTDFINDVQKVPGTSKGFSTASGKTINVTKKALTKANNFFVEEFQCKPDLNFNQESPKLNQLKPISHLKVKNLQNNGFSTASGKTIQISKNALSKTKRLFGDDVTFDNMVVQKASDTVQDATLSNTKFLTDSGPNINVTEKAWKNCADELRHNPELNLEQDISSSDLKLNNIQTNGFSTASGKTIQISKNALSKTKRLFGNDFTFDNMATQKVSDTVQDLTLSNTTCLTDSGPNINITEKSRKNCADELRRNPELNLEQEIPSSDLKLNNIQTNGFSTASGKSIQVSEDALKKCKQLFFSQNKATHSNKECSTAPGLKTKVFEEPLGTSILTNVGKNEDNFDLDMKDENINNSLLKGTPEKHLQKTVRTKKRLGISACKQIQIGNKSLDRAKMFFKELDDKDGLAPITPVRSNIYSSTPLKQTYSLTKQVFKPSLADLNITPVKCLRKESTSECSPILMQMRTEGDTTTWIRNMQNEYDILQKRLHLIAERQSMLQEQQKYLNSQNSSRRRQVLGVLSEKKKSSARVTVRQLLDKRKPGDSLDDATVKKSFNWNITPRNAVNLHFNCSWNNECPAAFYTKDGAVVIPTLDNLVGLSEIKAAFEAMLGVDPSLIPCGWIENHFKWIVWKLASYERNFSDVFAETLTVENIIQQLKYRYDREIDKVERSALRRILEKDDIPQKRMVLCVSDIAKIGNLLEVELTDGWYSVWTTIDDLLVQQINLSKIVVGTKLIIQGAEILNCEGCHPLEVPGDVRLKINFNCTRRAAWDAKLGYQKIVKPFSLSLDSIHCEGGIVGCVKIYIARVYPLRYMEKFSKGKAVWRNIKAEEKRIREWENQQTKELEAIHQKVRDEYEKELKNKQNIKVSYNDLSEIDSPETLYGMLEASSDSDSFKEKLTSTQLQSIMDYHQIISDQRNSEISSRISKGVRKLQNSQRDVYPVLKLLVMDRQKVNEQTYVLHIWKPTEEHLHLLKEGSNFLIYNILLKSNGEFSSTYKTYFKSEPITQDVTKYQRGVVTILELQQPMSKLVIKEFDTIGTIVQINKSEFNQEVWVTDCIGNLLLVKVFEGSNTCCLFDNISRGQNLAFINIIHCEPRAGFAQGIANQFSVVTNFPQQKFLQEALSQLPTDKSLLDDCDTKIKKLKLIKAQGMGSSISTSRLSTLMDSGSVIDDNLEDTTMIPSYLTSTDIALSLIDTDQYFENV